MSDSGDPAQDRQRELEAEREYYGAGKQSDDETVNVLDQYFEEREGAIIKRYGDKMFATPSAQTPPPANDDGSGNPMKDDGELHPKFLDIIENGWASEQNPTRVGYFIRSGRRTGRLNPGKYFVLTNGKGKFWEVMAKNEKLNIIGNLIQAHAAKANERGAIDFRSKVSTGGRPLSAPPEIVKQPVPCPRCGAEEYADWVLYPHQLYNSYMPGGIGHYCFPCFAAIVSELQAALHSQQETEEK